MRPFLAGILIFLAVLVGEAEAQTPCPTVTDTAYQITVTVTGAPSPVRLALYDLKTKGLSVQFDQNRADYFVGVPYNLIIGRVSLAWSAIQPYPQAIVQEGSTCPLLADNGSPILIGGVYPTVSPSVTSQCATLTGNDRITMVGVLNAPYNVYEATYDQTLQWLFVAFAGGQTSLFTSVPLSAFNNYTIQWNALSTYPEAVMAQGFSACPLLAQ